MGSPDALFGQRLRVIRGKRKSGPEAQRIGLANEVWPLAELKERAIELAHELAAQPALAVRRRNARLSKRPWALRMRRRE
jgi:enoyl-CoA hydratase